MKSARLLTEKGMDSGSSDAFRVILAGLPAAFPMHAGVTLFIWVFFKAMGGKASFPSAYFHTGAVCDSLWVLMPFISAFQAGIRSNLITGLAILFSFHALILHMVLLEYVFKMSRTRIVIAISAAIIYIGCFLYLWL